LRAPLAKTWAGTASHRQTTDGLTPNPDGSLTLHIQHERPDDQTEAAVVACYERVPKDV
jgi:hypothetical protein